MWHANIELPVKWRRSCQNIMPWHKKWHTISFGDIFWFWIFNSVVWQLHFSLLQKRRFTNHREWNRQFSFLIIDFFFSFELGRFNIFLLYFFFIVFLLVCKMLHLHHLRRSFAASKHTSFSVPYSTLAICGCERGFVPSGYLFVYCLFF